MRPTCSPKPPPISASRCSWRPRVACRRASVSCDAAAGLDVFEDEPNVHPALLEVPNVVLTPHIGSASVPTRRAMANLAIDNLLAVLGTPRARPPTPLNPEVLSHPRHQV